MGFLEITVGKVRGVLKDITTRARYDRQAVQLLQPFIDGHSVEPSWTTTFDIYLLNGGRDSFVFAASGLLPPDKRARLLVTLVTEMKQQTFHPRSKASDGDIIHEIWARSGDKDKLREAVRSMKIPRQKRKRVREALSSW